MGRPKSSTDAHALRLITEGRIICDPATGVVVVDGQPRGVSCRTTGYQRVYAAGVLMMAHRVVYLFVHGGIPEGLVINHRDGNKRNNRIGNLEAITHRQNVLHAIRHAQYVGTYPEDTVSGTLAAQAAALAAQPDVRREHVAALLGTQEDYDDEETTEALMSSPSPAPFSARRMR